LAQDYKPVLKSNALASIGGVMASFASLPAFAAGGEIGAGAQILYFLVFAPVICAFGWAFGYVLRSFSRKMMLVILLIIAMSIVLSAIYGGAAYIDTNRFVERSIALIFLATPFVFAMMLSWSRMDQSVEVVMGQRTK
jgi:hypothetical protein